MPNSQDARAALERAIADIDGGKTELAIDEIARAADALDADGTSSSTTPAAPAPTSEPASVDNTVAAADNTAASSSTQDARPVTDTAGAPDDADAGGPDAPATSGAEQGDGAEAAPDAGDHRITDAIAHLEQAIALLSD